jgi:D5 N terminal like/Bifunctional DNA primase/polymerase, N-terminal
MNHTAKFKEIAMAIIARGVHVVPTYRGYRHPALPAWQQIATTDPKVVEEWSRNGHADSNCVSVAKFGGVFMLDIDDLEAAKKRGIPELPKTFAVRTPGGGIHPYFKHTKESEMLGGYCAVKQDGEKIVEFKGHNAACCSPGCTREDGGVYRVIDDSPIVPIPDELVESLRKEAVSKPKPEKFRPIRQYHPDFEREDLHDHYGWSFAKDFTKNGEDYYVFEGCPIKGGPHKNQVESRKCCLIYGKRGIRFSCFVCDEYDWDGLVEFMETEHDIEPYPYAIFADEAVEEEETTESIAAFLNSDPEPEEPEIDLSGYHFRNTDTGNAERLVRMYGDHFRYVRETNEWKVWDTKRWKADHTGVIDRAAKEVVQEIFAEAMEEQDEATRNSKLSWAMQSEGRAKRDAMIDLAAKEHAVVSNTEDYDQNPWLFNCQNGTIDLKTGKLRPHFPFRLIRSMILTFRLDIFSNTDFLESSRNYRDMHRDKILAG